MTGKTPAEVAALLGWPLGTYKAIEAGLARLSEGQQNDVRRVLGEAIDAAGVRDSIRRKPWSAILRPGGKSHGLV